MRKVFVVSALVIGSAVWANHSIEAQDTESLRSYNFGACNFWTYSSDSRGYLCSSYPSQVTVPDAYSVEEENRQLRTRIEDLEKRVKALESRP
jgi:hypothetical protein